ncbi:MAG: hypothetical protein QM564_12365 [Bergeyella sp.]
MLRKLKFYFIGLVPGLIIVFFVLNQKGASCSGYLPNSRVIAESLSKDFSYQPEFLEQMSALKINEKLLRDSILTHGFIDFDKSQAQKKPCPQYFLNYPEKNPKFEITFIKCKENVTFNTLKKIR